MENRILIVAASNMELDSLRKVAGIKGRGDNLRFNNLNITAKVLGIGSVNSVWTLMDYLRNNPKPDLIINIGIAGSYSDGIKVGEVVLVADDRFADVGIEEREGFVSLWDSDLVDSSDFPFDGGIIKCKSDLFSRLSSVIKPVSGITVNTVSGTANTIRRLSEKYNPDIETMEGAAILYTAAREQIPVIALRSISNMVEPRNRKRWDINLALSELSIALKKVVDIIEQL